ncbi:MAG: PaaI family thioesterase [Pseudomonadota bacterium]
MTDARPLRVPDGFSPMQTRGPFTDINGPIWRKPGHNGAIPQFGFLPEKRHTNSLGFVHGGMLSTLMDSAMAQAAYEHFRCRLVTLTLQVQFHSAVFRGRWAEIEVGEPVQTGTDVALTATLRSRGALCLESEATFRLFPRAK